MFFVLMSFMVSLLGSVENTQSSAYDVKEKRLGNSFWNNTSSMLEERELFCYDDSLFVVTYVTDKFGWTNIVFIYQSGDENLVRFLVSGMERNVQELQAIYYDVTYMNQTEMKHVLSIIHSEEIFKAVIILGKKTVQFLKLANYFDFESKKTTNFRSNSFWIIWASPEGYTDFNFNFNLQNILVMLCENTRIHPYNVLTGITMTIPIHCFCLENVEHVHCQQEDLFPNHNYKLNGRHLVIGTLETFLIWSEIDNKNRTAYKGLLADLTEVIAQTMNFTYTFVQPADLRYGDMENGTWISLMGQLAYLEVDMVVADLTITKARSEVADFILPAFVTQNLGVLYRKNIDEGSIWVKVFRPLQLSVYLCILASILVVGFLLYILDLDYINDMQQSESTNKLYVSNFLMSLISLVGFVSLRGNGLWPRNTSARILVAFFWFFCLVITGTYIGNLTAKLTETTELKPFTSMEELVRLSDWKWGLNGGGLTQAIVQNSKSGLLSKFWEGVVKFNKTDPDVLIWDLEKHFDKVLYSNEKYAFIILDAKYFILNGSYCNIGLVDSVISSLSSAIAVTKNSYLKKSLENIMWALFNSGVLQNIADTVYMDHRPNRCTVAEKKRPMLLEDMSGLLFVVCFGLGMTTLTLLAEIVYKRLRKT